MSKEGEREAMHFHACTIYFLFVAPPSLIGVLCELVNPGVSAWLHLRGRDDEAFINKGSEGRWHRLMDDSTLFCLTRRPLPLDVPGHTLAWGALLRLNYQSAGIVPDCTVQREWRPYTPTMSASSLAPIRCIMTAAAWLMPFKGSNVSASCINGQ